MMLILFAFIFALGFSFTAFMAFISVDDIAELWVAETLAYFVTKQQLKSMCNNITFLF